MHKGSKSVFRRCRRFFNDGYQSQGSHNQQYHQGHYYNQNQYNYQGAYQQQQQQHQQQQQQQQQHGTQKGSWGNPMIVQVSSRGEGMMYEAMKVAVFFYLLFQFGIVRIQIGMDEEEEEDGKEKDASGETTKKESKPSSSTSSKESSSSSKSSFSMSMFSSSNKEQFTPVDLEAANHSVHWDDVLGCDEAKGELQEVVEFLKNPTKFQELGGNLPKGYLLVGPPGTGKTMLAKAIAKEAKVPFYYASGSQFEEVFMGVGSKRVRALFEAARSHKSPVLIFIDEIDAVGSKRSKYDASHDRATINQLLSEMDGFQSSEQIIVIAATNSPKSLDKALTRAGRIDRQVTVDPPDLKGRKQILNYYLSKTVHSKELSIDTVAKGTGGMTGADLSNLINIATIHAAKAGLEEVDLSSLEYAKDRVSMGLERKSRKIPEHERKNTAYHEAGHALVAMFTKASHPLHKATIIPRGQALGLTVQLPTDDTNSMSLAQMKARLRVLMGGRIAEQTVFGNDHVTSGASNDLEQATKLANAMVRKFGLSSGMGLVDYSFSDDPEGIYLSDSTRALIENEVKTILDTAYSEATDVIVSKRPILNKIAEGLLQSDTLTGKQMREMAGLPEPVDSS
eukprot:TRINITY_DN1918_c1_g1_i1.p1 TRINITY_DN1918_c1_g1~~TRINITY_DN1918_c1_g1_i1.p1  ORF type:complete len:622 (+),score=141.24 TRINITY_DN1918_c1_g1_i1:44-1909(+)